jgi:predicted Zn-dependent protease
VTNIGTTIGTATGTISQSQAESIRRSSKAVGKAFESITPEQEYYIGRAVAATVLAEYEVLDDVGVTLYINLLGQALAQASTRPETFRGYHFLVLDSDEINAFAAPGGLILVSAGMLGLCESEDELAAVLAHEIGHIEGRHGLRQIKKGRLTSALTILAAEGVKSYSGDQLAQITEAFEGSISDITSTLVNSGYARKLERQADESALRILETVGYDPSALERVLRTMKEQLKPEGRDFAKTHPDPDDRISDISKEIGELRAAAAPNARQERFETAMRGA